MPKAHTSKKKTFTKVLPYILIIAGVIGLIAAAVLTYDHNKIAQNPNYIPSCNLNPIIACGTVIRSTQAQAFHFPNPYIGLVVFPVLVTVGMTLLAGAKFKRWFWLGLEGGTIFGLGFIHWLFFETVYRIHALCPYCMAVWVVTITTFWYVTLYNLQAGHIKLPPKLLPLQSFLVRHHLDILILWFLVIAALILKHFWYYYGHNF
ncbi:MAG TPA: vitamin K epoxide reductase family protein [Candidatus Saccharimonadales bacterium]|nr:vitamin K epoxide reductase family protein [Candidatus Saccharimonadales bacterium]